MKYDNLSDCIEAIKINKELKRNRRTKKVLKQLNKQFKELICPECQKKIRWIYISKSSSVYLRCECKFDIVLWKRLFSFSKWKIHKSGKNAGLNIDNKDSYRHTIDLYE